MAGMMSMNTRLKGGLGFRGVSDPFFGLLQQSGMMYRNGQDVP